MHKRKLGIVAISDVHLGTYGCHARELHRYLRSIQTDILILNGDIIDIWEFRKKYFPPDHLKVVKEIFRMASKGTKVYYLTGNHDDILRRFGDLRLGPIHLRDQLVLQVNGKRTWIFHGDVFDLSIQVTPLLAKLGSRGYDWLIRINRLVNKLLDRLHRPRVSLAGTIKQGVKRAVQFVQDFERLAIQAAVEQGYDAVLCGHIHRPDIREVTLKDRTVTYLNAGDWVENLSALEHNGREWSLRHFHETDHRYRNPSLLVEEDLFEEDQETEQSIEELQLIFSWNDGKGKDLTALG